MGLKNKFLIYGLFFLLISTMTLAATSTPYYNQDYRNVRSLSNASLVSSGYFCLSGLCISNWQVLNETGKINAVNASLNSYVLITNYNVYQTFVNTTLSGIQVNVSSVNTSLNQEITDRGNADTTLQNNIDTEETNRVSNDSYLQSQINLLSNTSLSNLSILVANHTLWIGYLIDSNTTTNNYVNVLSAWLSNETINRTNADTILLNLINSLNTTGAIQSLGFYNSSYIDSYVLNVNVTNLTYFYNINQSNNLFYNKSLIDSLLSLKYNTSNPLNFINASYGNVTYYLISNPYNFLNLTTAQVFNKTNLSQFINDAGFLTSATVNLTNYYNKTEIDNSQSSQNTTFNNLISERVLNSTLNNYYNKTEIDASQLAQNNTIASYNNLSLNNVSVYGNATYVLNSNNSYVTQTYGNNTYYLKTNPNNYTNKTNLSQFVDDLGNRGYYVLSNFTNDEDFINSSYGNATYYPLNNNPNNYTNFSYVNSTYEPKLPSTPTNPTLQYLNGLKQWSTIIIGAGGFQANLYFTTINSSINTSYKELSYIPETNETELSATISSGEYLLRTYLYNYSLDTDVIDSGVWTTSYRVKVSNAVQTTFLKLEAFVRLNNGSETTLWSSYSSEIDNTDYATLQAETFQPLFNVNSTSKLGFRVYANTSSPVPITVYTVVGGTQGSYVNTPLAIRHNQLRDLNSDLNYQHYSTTGNMNTSGNWSADWFVGKTTLTSNDGWNTLNGTTITFNESRLQTSYYNASSFAMVRGTSAGSLSDTFTINDVTLNLTEATGSPALDVRVNFTNITDMSQAFVRYKTGSISGSMPVFQVYNYDKSQWEDIIIGAETTSFRLAGVSVFLSSKFIQNGTVQVRFYKSSVGSVANDYYFDWVSISKGYGLPQGEEVDPLSIHSDGSVQLTNNWDAGSFNITASWFLGYLNYSYLQNIPSYVKDYSSDIISLQNNISSVNASLQSEINARQSIGNWSFDKPNYYNKTEIDAQQLSQNNTFNTLISERVLNSTLNDYLLINSQNYTSAIGFNNSGLTYQLNLARVGMSNLTALFSVPYDYNNYTTNIGFSNGGDLKTLNLERNGMTNITATLDLSGKYNASNPSGYITSSQDQNNYTTSISNNNTGDTWQLNLARNGMINLSTILDLSILNDTSAIDNTTIIRSFTSLIGDVTGTIGATVVGDDTHSHTKSTITIDASNITSGTIEDARLSGATIITGIQSNVTSVNNSALKNDSSPRFLNINLTGDLSTNSVKWYNGFWSNGNFTGTCYNGTALYIGTNFNASSVGC